MKRPNIIFILADDQGAWSLGSAGNPDVRTPNLDRMAQEGMRFSHFFCASPVCSPARASILTGCLPSGHGILDWLRGGSVNREDFSDPVLKERYRSGTVAQDFLEDLHTYPKVLADHGYRCALAGKWHLGNSLKPADGFHDWYTIGLGGCPYFLPDIVEDGQVRLEERYVTELITERALENLNELCREETPFYLSIHYTAPHGPWDASNHQEEYLKLYKNCEFKATPDLALNPNQTTCSACGDTPEKRRECLTGYYAAITAMDAGIGKLLNRLEELGADEDTLVIFSADNGVCMGHHGVWGKGNATFPQNMYEESVSIPFLAWRKGKPVSTHVPQGLYSHYDLYRTILDYAGIRDYPVNTKSMGRSFCSLLEGENEDKDRDTVLIFEEYGAVRMLRSRKYKYIHRYPYGPCQLYDMILDPEEQCNLVDCKEYDEIRSDLQKKLYAKFLECSEPMFNGCMYPVWGKGQKKKLDGDGSQAFWEDLEYVNQLSK